VRLRRQNRELAHVNVNNNITGVNLGRGGDVWLRRFLGRGRNGMWLGRLALYSLRTWNQNSSFFSRGKILECSPYYGGPPTALLFITMYLVSSSIMVAHRRQLMPFWHSLLRAGERLL